jgi:CSLREA domain-containing protein
MRRKFNCEIVYVVLFVCLVAFATESRAATFIVNATGDQSDTNAGDGVCVTNAGNCSLRAAIQEANAFPGVDNIHFSISGAGVHTITPGSNYPFIGESVTIEGRTQGGVGYIGVPLIQINGQNTLTTGIEIRGGGSTVRGLIINRFTNQGIWIHINGDNTIEGCYIGTNSDGTSAQANGTGITIETTDNTIGGTTVARRNIISGNTNAGVRLDLGTAFTGGNTVTGNYIGTNAAGTAAVGNATGVTLENGSNGNTIGSTTAGGRNVISGNEVGVRIDNSDSNIVLGNYIGTDAAGLAPIGNTVAGVLVEGTSIENEIGGTAAGARNIISGNTSGVEFAEVEVADLSRNFVWGNYIGTDLTGAVGVGNTSGVKITDSPQVTIGGELDSQRNIISGNTYGVEITGDVSIQNQVYGNYIGIDATGTAALGNTSAGVRISSGATYNSVGIYNAIGAAVGNIIAHTVDGDGVQIVNQNTRANQIYGNSIHSNSGLGIELDDTFVNGNGVTPNDEDDPDIGANDRQNFPVLTEAVNESGATNISGSLNSLPGPVYRIEFFSSASCDASGNGEGETFIAWREVSTNVNGDASFSAVLTTQVPLGRYITATATIRNGIDSTSEFSECIQVTSPLPPVVTNTNDSGPGSLRQAILDTNTVAGLETIVFDIPGAGVKTINLLTPLPTITDPVIIDGRTQPGFAGLPLIELNGASAGVGANADGLKITGGGSTIRGLAINRFGGAGIELSGPGGNTIRGCMIGTDPTGTTDLGNVGNGIYINGSADNDIGGAGLLARNLISGNEGSGIYIFTSASSGNEIVNTIIGLDINRTTDLGNSMSGINIDEGSNNIVGSTTGGLGNVISGNDGDGVRISESSGNQVKGNFIGTNENGALDLGNGASGVNLQASATASIVGGADGAGGNTIAFNTTGVNVTGTATGNQIRGNAIFSNDNLGIDLLPAGITANDPSDPDTGANNLQNFPVLTTAYNQDGKTTIQGTLNSTGNTRLTVEFFSQLSCDSGGNGEGQTYVGAASVQTNAAGNASFSYVTSTLVPLGRNLTATATRNTAPLDTSEFSACRSVVPGPGKLTFSAATYPANENTGTRTITVNRTDGDVGTITVDYTTSDGTATASQDYTATSGTLTFLTGETVKTFDVQITNDAIDEPNETFSVTLSNQSPTAGIGPYGSAVVTIVDNDNPPQIVISNTSVTETNAGSSAMNFTVSLSSASSLPVTVDYSTENGTATANLDYLPASGQISFAPLEMTKTIQVLVLGDVIVELDETFAVNLSNPTNATFGDAQGLGAIIDNDNPGRLAFSSTPYGGAEGTQVLVTVSRTGGSAGTVSVDYATSSTSSATPGSDYTSTSGTLVFADGELTKNFSVNLLQDTQTEPTETFNVVLSNPIGGATLGTPSTASVSILDDDGGSLYAIGGTILRPDSTPLSGATVNLAGSQNGSVTTNTSGQYIFTDLAPNGNYSVTPVAIGYTFEPISRQYASLSANVANANFAATPAPSRQLRVVGGNATPGQPVTAIVELVAQGDENSIGFSMNFNQSILSNPIVALNPDAASASLIVNDTEAGSGRLGVILALPSGSAFSAGTRSLLTITFATAATNQYSSPLTFADTPVQRQIANVNADPLPSTYTDGSVTFAQGWEADVAPRPTGNSTGTITVADFTQVGRFAAGLDTNYQLNEFQRADCAPRLTLGNGQITVSDYTQAGRYAASLDPTALAGGQYAPRFAVENETKWDDVGAVTQVRVVNTFTSPGQQVTVTIMTDAQGGENGFGFTLDYDPSRLSTPVVQLGSGVPAGTTLIPNTMTAGKVGVVLGLPFGVGLTPGTKELVTIRFNVAIGAVGLVNLTFSDSPVVREVSDINSNVLASNFTGGTVTISAPTAAGVNVGGRVVGDTGFGVPGAVVTVTDSLGNSRSTLTNPFGYYRFGNVRIGEFYVFTVTSKRFSFEPRTVFVVDELYEVNFEPSGALSPPGPN